MNFIWGIILTRVTLKVWIGQIIIVFFPKIAEKINIIEPESNVDKTFFLDLRGGDLGYISPMDITFIRNITHTKQ